jgi:hypothetical protein
VILLKEVVVAKEMREKEDGCLERREDNGPKDISIR